MAASEQRIDAIRDFNRFYTRAIGVLGERLLESRFSLAEGRILYELATRDRPAATELSRDLGLDPGYLSRILRRLNRDGLVERAPSELDGRRWRLSLTSAGRAAFAELDGRSRAAVDALLAPMDEAAQWRLVGALDTARKLLAPRSEPPAELALRSHRPGDLGWIVYRHGVVYAEEHGFDERFELLVAEVVTAFARGFDHRREGCWIAELEAEPVGSVMLVRHDDATAQLRLLLVEPAARGRGVGRRLVDTCIEFARSAGYRKLRLWTNDALFAARRLYEITGFRLVASEPHERFGRPLVGETWERDLYLS